MKIKIDVKALFSTIIFVFSFIGLSYGQPLLGSKIIYNRNVFYPDVNKENLYYYLPGKLSLKKGELGKPDFLLTQMRYQGTACANDQGESRYFNILSFTVEIENSPRTDFELARQHFGVKATVIPLPIRHISTALVSFVENAHGEGNREIVKLADRGVVESGIADDHAFWTERTYTMKLQNHEAEIIINQIKENDLALSLSYSYFADGLWGDYSEINLEGDEESINELWSGLDSTFLNTTSDTIVQPYFVFGDAFPINIDAEKWPNVLVQVDLNEEIPPTYPAIEIRCYDFNEQLNPDLYIKKVEIHSTAVNGRSVKVSSKFYKKSSDVTTKNIYFPYAVRMDKTIKYRVVSYAESGDRINSDWTTTDACTAMIDITESHENQFFAKEELEVELNPQVFDSLDVEKIIVSMSYKYKDEITDQEITFSSDESVLYRSIYFWKDKDSAIYLKSAYTGLHENTIEKSIELPSDRYVYLNYNSFR